MLERRRKRKPTGVGSSSWRNVVIGDVNTRISPHDSSLLLSITIIEAHSRRCLAHRQLAVSALFQIATACGNVSIPHSSFLRRSLALSRSSWWRRHYLGVCSSDCFHPTVTRISSCMRASDIIPCITDSPHGQARQVASRQYGTKPHYDSAKTSAKVDIRGTSARRCASTRNQLPDSCHCGRDVLAMCSRMALEMDILWRRH